MKKKSGDKSVTEKKQPDSNPEQAEKADSSEKESFEAELKQEQEEPWFPILAATLFSKLNAN